MCGILYTVIDYTRLAYGQWQAGDFCIVERIK